MPAYQVHSVNTAGAGDAFLAGMIIGIINGMSITGDTGDSCLRYAMALACMSVTSKDTIHFGITNDSLREFISIQEITKQLFNMRKKHMKLFLMLKLPGLLYCLYYAMFH